MKAIDPNKVYSYVHPEDKKLPQEQQTTFLYRYLKMLELADIRDEMFRVTGFGDDRVEKFTTGTMAVKTLRAGLKGWENFLNEDGVAIPFDAKRIDDMIDMIPDRVRTDLANHIRGESSPEKNS